MKIIEDGLTGERLRKANFDVEIAVDAMDMIDTYETAILFSGDSDFDHLVRRLKKKGKTILVFSTRHHIAKELIKGSNKYFDIRKFRKILSR